MTATAQNISTTPTPTLAVIGLPRLLLRLEGLTVFSAAIALYIHQGYSGWLFAGLLLAPDLSALGYLINKRIGALSYNIAHTYVTAALIGLLALLTESHSVLAIAIIAFAHIGMDRAVGYGLKYANSFKETHMGRVGK